MRNICRTKIWFYIYWSSCCCCCCDLLLLLFVRDQSIVVICLSPYFFFLFNLLFFSLFFFLIYIYISSYCRINRLRNKIFLISSNLLIVYIFAKMVGHNYHRLSNVFFFFFFLRNLVTEWLKCRSLIDDIITARWKSYVLWGDRWTGTILTAISCCYILQVQRSLRYEIYGRSFIVFPLRFDLTIRVMIKINKFFFSSEINYSRIR